MTAQRRPFARVWRHKWATLALAAVLTVCAVAVSAQPVRSPWWTYADADASYAASALNLLLGEPVNYLDHPGLPVTESATLVFGLDALASERNLALAERTAYADERLLDLDRARPVFRGLAIAFYLAGVLLSFLLVTRLFGHWVWGLSAGLLWLAAPGLLPMSIQLRPDVLLAVLCLLFGYLVARGLDTQATAQYAGAAFVAGLAFMVKVHAVGLLPPLALALAWRRPLDAWRPTDRLVLVVVAALAIPALLLNWGRGPVDLTAAQWQILAAFAAAWALALALARVTAVGVVAVALLAGIALPVALDVPDGLQALVRATEPLRGVGVQEGIEPFSTQFTRIDDLVGDRVVAFFVLAAVAGVVGLATRQPHPVVWATGALAMGVLAFSRPPNVHYFAPAFVLSTLSVLWLFRRAGTSGGFLVLPLVALLAWPAYANRDAPAAEARRFAGVVAASQAFVDGRLRPAEFAYVPSYWPFADSRHFELVHLYVSHVPAYTYRYLPATARAREFAEASGLRPRYYVGPQAADIDGTARVTLDQAGTFTVRRLPGADLVLEIIGP